MKKILTLLLLCGFFSVFAQPQFDVLEQSVELIVYPEGTIEVWYFLKILTTAGPQNGIYLGIPSSSEAEIRKPSASVYQGSQILRVEQEASRLKIWFPQETKSGDVTELKVNFFADGLIHKDTEGRVGFLFIPGWWEGKRVESLKVKIIMPEGVQPKEVLANNNLGKVFSENGKTVVWYEAQSIDPHDFAVGASLPEKYITGSLEKPTPSPTTHPQASSAAVTVLALLFSAFVLIFIIGIFIAIVRGIKKLKYIAPELSMESLGARKDLDAVEAAVVLETHPFKLINILLLSLVKKGRIKIVDWKPVRVEILPEREKVESFSCPNCGAPQKILAEKYRCEYCGTEIAVSGKLAYYENDFLLHGFKKNGGLDEDGAKLMLKSLVDKVNNKMKGYSRPETQKYYKEQIEKYWGDLKTVSDEEKYRLFGERIEWLASDDTFEKKSSDAFKDVSSSYNTPSWWIWYNLGRGSVTGRDFSQKINDGFSSTQKNLGLSESVLKSSLAAAVEVKHAHKSCVCACASCACACACVSCACACASGGGF